MPQSKPVHDLGAVGCQVTFAIIPQAAMPRQSELTCLSHLLVVVCVTVICAHWPGLRNEALCFDDNQYLMTNALVQDPSLRSAKRFLVEILSPSTVRGYYQPLTMISLMVDNIWGGKPGNLHSFHRTSLALHVGNVALLVVLIYLIFHNPWVAALSGLFFGIHPVTAETVAWISERKTLLSSFFALWSLLCYVRYVKEPQRRDLYVCSIVMYPLALLCKPTAIVLPFLMIMMDLWPLRRSKGFRRALVEKIPLFAVGAGAAVVTYISQSRSGGVRLPNEYGAWRIPLMLCYDVVFYLQKIFYPVSLSPHYSSPEPFVFLHPRLFLSVIGTVIIMILLVVSLRWTRSIAMGFAMFFGALLPTMQIVGVTNEVVANRYLYLPSWALLFLLASLLVCLLHSIRDRQLLHLALLTSMLFLLSGEMVCLRNYLAHWHDTASIHKHMLTVSPDAHKVHNNWGLVLVQQGRIADGINHLREAARLAEREGNAELAYTNLGEVLIHSGNPHSGYACLEKAVLASKKPAIGSLALAWTLATHTDPNFVNPMRAVELAEDVVFTKNKPTPNGLDTLAAAYAANGQFTLAIETGKKAIDLAVKSDKGPLAGTIGSRLQLYREGHRYCEDPTVEVWVKATP